MTSSHTSPIVQEILEDLSALIRFETVSADPNPQEFHNCLAFLQQFLEPLGFHVEIWSTPSLPCLFAEKITHPNNPTLLLYNHYDVQPIDPVHEWHTPPFTPVIENNHIYGRGACDNKGQLAYVLHALKHTLLHNPQPHINFKCLFEGDEEIGSPGFAHLSDTQRARLKSTYGLVTDLHILNAHTPSLTLSTRGILTFSLRVDGPNSDLHSGSEGGVCQNPLHSLTHILAKLHDSQGRVTLPNFYDGILPLPDTLTQRVHTAFDPDTYHKLHHVFPLGGETDVPVWQRRGLRPTLEINGIEGGYTGKGFKTVLPKTALAHISCRTIPGQNLTSIKHTLETFCQTHALPGTQAHLTCHDTLGHGTRVDTQSLLFQTLDHTMTHIFDTPTLYTLEGGSIPLAHTLDELCSQGVTLFGLGLDSDKIHAPNEHFSIQRLEQGFLILSQTFNALASKENVTHG